MTCIFKSLIGCAVEVYIDDIVIKSNTHSEHLYHLKKAFKLMCKYDMNLNPLKCAFKVSAGKFSGFMVTQRGIEVNPTQVKVVLEFFTFNNKKDTQCLINCLIALGRFIAHFIDKLRLFFNILRETKTSSWTSECGHAFEAIKWYIAKPPILSNLEIGEELYMYVAVSRFDVSVILFWHNQCNGQKFVYYVSKVLVDIETWYS